MAWLIVGNLAPLLTIGNIPLQMCPLSNGNLPPYRMGFVFAYIAFVVALGSSITPLSAQALLEITSPSNGSLFRPGQTVYIKVRTVKKYDSVNVLTCYPLNVGKEPQDADPLEFSFRLPPDLDAGFYEFRAIGYSQSPVSPGFDASEPLTIDVEPSWSPTADGSRLVRDDHGVTVDTEGIPLRHRSAISYPPDALAQGIEGTVVAEITPDWEGRVEGVHVLSGPVVLSRHVIQALAMWHYAKGVGHIKARGVKIRFNLTEARRTPSPGNANGARLGDNLPYEFWVSGNPNRRYKLKRIDILGLSEDEAGKLRTVYEHSNMREGDEVSVPQIAALKFVTSNSDHDLRTYFFREGAEISVTAAPLGFIASEKQESPAIETEPVPRSADPERAIHVSAADQARKLISMVHPQYPGNSDWNYVQGVVRVVFTVGKDGRVIRADAGGPSALREVAEEAVKQWIYSPTVVNGTAFEVFSEVYLDFFLPY
jgi:outer membrane biosynthesis protein TonB